MKKLFLLLLASLMVFTLCSCGKAEISDNQNADFPTDYLSDDSVLIVSEKEDINEETIKEHYENGGIILVKNWELASEVQELIATTMTTEFSDDDLAVIFYKMADGVPGISVVQGNTANLDREIDEMIESAKAAQ